MPSRSADVVDDGCAGGAHSILLSGTTTFVLDDVVLQKVNREVNIPAKVATGLVRSHVTRTGQSQTNV